MLETSAVMSKQFYDTNLNTLFYTLALTIPLNLPPNEILDEIWELKIKIEEKK